MASGASRLARLATASRDSLDAADRLPPLRGEPEVDVRREAAPDEAFSFRRVLKPFRRPLAVGAVLVVIDTLSTLAGPLLIRRAIDGGVVAKSLGVLWMVCGDIPPRPTR